MMLFEYFNQILTVMEHTSTPDGEGGETTSWTPGETFLGSLIRDSEQRITLGESYRLYDTYTLTVDREMELGFHSVIRDGHGQTYRITSDSVQTPKTFTDLNLRQYKAERWDTE